ncbi:MAG: stage V sporulation protein D [Dehalococcoidia bacterium]
MAHERATRTRRVWLPAAGFLLFAAVVLARLVQVQVLEHDRYAARARNELLDSNELYARRGAILDRNGHVLSTSVETWDIYVMARTWKDDRHALSAAAALGEAIGEDPQTLIDRVRAGEAVDVLVARDVPYEVGRKLIDGGVHGIIALPNAARFYPEGDVAASILGVLGQDNVGLAGIEAAYNDLLQGRPGRVVYERDTTGDPIPLGQFVTREPEPGHDLVLTIDRYLQRLAEETLTQAVKEHKAKGGTIIVMDPATGEILAMASMPALQYSALDYSDPGVTDLMRNRAVSDLYEPGSVMKVVTAAAAIDAGVVTPDTTYVDNGTAWVYDVPIRNWDFNVYGEQTMTGVLQHSINTGAVFMAERLGKNAFHAYLEAFGFGRPTGIDLLGEAMGIIRTPDDPDWSPVDLATQSFGQSMAVTPIQMVTAIAAAINGGQLLRPHIVKAIVAPDGARQDVKPEVLGTPISAATSATIRDMLGQVVFPGGWHPAQPQRYSAGGKSGTANVPIPNGYDDTQVASFVGFAPLHDPEILVYVKLDENADLLTGTVAAGPIFASLVDRVLAYLNVPPDGDRYVERP